MGQPALGSSVWSENLFWRLSTANYVFAYLDIESLPRVIKRSFVVGESSLKGVFSLLNWVEMCLKLVSFSHSSVHIFSYFMKYSLWKLDSCSSSKLSSKLTVHAIVSIPCFYSTQIRISLIIFLGINYSVCHLWKLKMVAFKSFVIWESQKWLILKVLWYGCQYPWLHRSFSRRYKKLHRCFRKGRETFFSLDPLRLVVTVLPLEFQTRV